MRNIIMMLFLLCNTGIVAAQKTINVAILLYPGMELQDFAGPTDVFVKAGEVTRGQYNVYTVAFNKEMVYTEAHKIGIQPAYDIHTMPKPNVLVIPGAPMTVIDSLSKDSSLLSFLRYSRDSVDVTMSVCTGAYLLGSAGVLDHHHATTHFFVADDFEETFPAVKVVRAVRYVDEGNIITTSGVTSGIDGALHLVERYSGEQLAGMTARGMQYTPHKEETWPVSPAGMKYSHLTTTETDVVCGMAMVDKRIKTEYKGKTYYFCSEVCKKAFIKAPTKYIK